MDFMTTLRDWISPETLINAGYLVLFLVVFAESGLFFGFFLPGDSLLLVAGVAAAAGKLDIGLLIPIVFLGAVLGDQVGYWMGYKYGKRLFTREDSLLFHKDHLKRSEAFFQKHGNKTIVLGRFVPIVRTFAPILAGIGNVPYKTFLTYNLLGGALWGIGIPLLGYLLGNSIPSLEEYLNYVVIVVIVGSLIPVLLHIRGEKRKDS